MIAELARVLASLVEAEHGRQREMQHARTYRQYRDAIDRAIRDAAMRGETSVFVWRPEGNDSPADLLAMRLKRRGYRVRWMAYGPEFRISWGDEA